ncbi:efflux RND transporter periplasmic adaptor subunit [Marinicella sp. W31]|uniref:efflux RND transporter periplasmic adaptor subunit n=1 Tax=Marinicella sp. W31 TaxID=3023713 RepID=UPI0037571DD5
MKNIFKFTIPGVVLGILAVWITQSFFTSDSDMSEKKGVEEKPLYWVAPMDSNFHKDKPGKSPMGMDLVPVYASNLNGTESSSGEISISPTVINNLGVKTQEARLGLINNSIKTVGIVQYDEERLVHVHPRIEGWIDKLHVKSMGDEVSKGEVLYEIYSPELVNAQEEYILALKRNNSSLIRAAEARLKSLQISQEMIQSIRKNQMAFQNVPFYAPQDGVIEHLEIREGFYVKPGTTLMSIADLSSVWVEAQILSYQKSQLQSNANAMMRIKGLPGHIWEGHVEYIYPSLDSSNKTARARLIFSNETYQLKPNMYVDIEIEQPPLDALIIPKNAVIRLQDSNRVVILTHSGQYKSVNVIPGLSDENNVQIKSGLLPGDVVVTSAQFLIDSESSKTSDFDRMSLSDTDNVAFTTGLINEMSRVDRTLNISREAIEKWNRPAATMDFTVPENVNFDQFKRQQKIGFYFRAQSGDFIILHAEQVLPMQVVES